MILLITNLESTIQYIVHLKILVRWILSEGHSGSPLRPPAGKIPRREAMSDAERSGFQHGWKLHSITLSTLLPQEWILDVIIKRGTNISTLKRFQDAVARGFSQREGLDFEDIFAPIIRLESLWVLFAIAATYGLVSHLPDATNALHVCLVKNRQAYLYRDFSGCRSSDTFVRSYSLKQSAYLWNQKAKEFVTSTNFKQSSTILPL